MNDNFERINMRQVEKSFYMTLNDCFGIKGTLKQKVYCVNTYMFSKLWYTAQVVKMDKKKVDSMIKASMNFIYAGENERPVRPLNFRPKHLGGLGLVEASIKANALLIKSMISQRKEQEFTNMYGYEEKLSRWLDLSEEGIPVKEMYSEMIKEVYEKNGSVIPSRNEKKIRNIKWSNMWRNLEILRGLSPAEVEFAWKLSQDMLPIGRRIHRANVDKECKNELDDTVCRAIPDIYHTFVDCKSIKEDFEKFKVILQEILGSDVDDNGIVTLSLTHRSIRRRKMALWFIIKVLYGIYNKADLKSVLGGIIEDIHWLLKSQIAIGSFQEMVRAKDIVSKDRDGIG